MYLLRYVRRRTASAWNPTATLARVHLMSIFSRLGLVALALGAVGLMGCEPSQPAGYPDQPYPQQQYPQQQYPQQQYPQQPYPQPYAPPAAPPPAPPPPPVAPPPAPPAQPPGGQPTAIPGIEKKPDGTCWATPPAFGGAPAAPIQIPCPPGV